MIRVITLDDEQLALDNLDYILKKFDEIDVILSTTSPADVLNSLESLKPDLIFADISMPEINGMEIAEKIMEQQLPSKIIFITAYEQYALDAFRVNAVDYILKPVTTSKIQHALNRLHLLDARIALEKIHLAENSALLQIKMDSSTLSARKKGSILRWYFGN